jgi:predicted GH43/DUF377 family glycosyl hydrolase
MVLAHKLGVLLEKTDLDFESEGVLNPGVIKVGDDIRLFYRTVAKGNHSTIGYCKLSSPTNVLVRNDKPILIPQSDSESHSVEDPSILEIEGTYYLTYAAYNGVNALGALAKSTDLIHWKKFGIIVPHIQYDEFKRLVETDAIMHEKYVGFNEYQKSHERQDNKLFLWDKNVIFFTRKIDNKLCFLHQIKPDILLVVTLNSLDELTNAFWHNYFLYFDQCIVLSPKYDHEVSYIGGGCPPIETKEGWLIICHGVHDTVKGYVYSACAALLI